MSDRVKKSRQTKIIRRKHCTDRLRRKITNVAQIINTFNEAKGREAIHKMINFTVDEIAKMYKDCESYVHASYKVGREKNLRTQLVMRIL